MHGFRSAKLHLVSNATMLEVNQQFANREKLFQAIVTVTGLRFNDIQTWVMPSSLLEKITFIGIHFHLLFMLQDASKILGSDCIWVQVDVTEISQLNSERH